MFNFIRRMSGRFSRDMGIDLGTANTLVHVQGRGILLREPSVVAVNRQTNQVIEVGEEAKRMLGRTPNSIVAIRPLKDGVIADFDQTERMLRYFIEKVHRRKGFVHPVVVVGIPSGITEVERRAVIEATKKAGAKEAYLIEEPMAAAIGAGLPVSEPIGSMIVDIGGGTSEVAVISLGAMAAARSIRIAGDEIDEAIVNYIRQQFNLLIGDRTAEECKMTIGSASSLEQELSMQVRGRDLKTGLPRSTMITSEQVREAISDPINAIVETVKATLEDTPPELSADIMDSGIVLAAAGPCCAAWIASFRAKRECRCISPPTRFPASCWEPASAWMKRPAAAPSAMSCSRKPAWAITHRRAGNQTRLILMRPERDNRRVGALLLALLACGLLTALHGRAAQRGRTDPVSWAVRDMGLVPGQALIAHLGQMWHLSAGSLLAGPKLARENAALNARVLELSAQNTDLLAARAENARLRNLLGFEQASTRPLLAAQVTALKPNPHFDTLTLNQGSAHGVHPRSVVLSPNGALVGQVVDVSPRSCDVLLLTDADSSVGAAVHNHTPHGPVGLCQGEGAGRMQVTYLRTDSLLHVGDLVTTSGLGGVFRARFRSARSRRSRWTKPRSLQTAALRPAADFDHLEEAFVIQSAPPAPPAATPEASPQ